MITEAVPNTWQDLQEQTAQILRECGWSAETEVTVATVRGQVELDVLATETVQGREYKAIVECKNWASRVPQAVIHSFRTVVGDIGAHSGYIVSRAGFQAGAYQVRPEQRRSI
ncbi:restriction endonuclease [Rubellimicrobium roseum]|uniref:Restriction endonuclease n=1 Tax=Rubellimicrobium roseum TaxID=687525 RepID=A0A5C4N397_9RHOB|nr:restriction endonuclease [Rubellimicrobium roseum]